MSDDVSCAVKFFKDSWSNSSISEITTGHIHRSYLITSPSDPQNNLFLQRFNNQVFTNYLSVFNNVQLICEQLSRSDYSLLIPTPVRSDTSGEAFYKDSMGYIWRAFIAIPNVYSIDVADSEQRVYSAAKAFAEFQKALNNIDSSKIKDPIIGFMDNPARFVKLQNLASANSFNRLDSCKNEVDFIVNNQSYFKFIESSRNIAGNHKRVTHGDMKLNNVLFCQQSHTARSIIDLDTCMVGDYLYDYGDFMRIACANCAEDESDFLKIDISEQFFKAAQSGFKDGFPNALAAESWDLLKKAAAEVTLTIATRFLTDYLDGDRYFRTKYDSHNLVRARCQLELFKRWVSK